ncbi:hypothetical protein [Mucilaginibacter pedocola]|uniref:hypothetical protein n=1 Tax=Mucilaginibacter pedocola TaxID=1792845 RepID=UPI0012DDD961|nr:hypothetical protein [Mucilaginibacter pedocola]
MFKNLIIHLTNAVGPYHCLSSEEYYPVEVLPARVEGLPREFQVYAGHEVALFQAFYPEAASQAALREMFCVLS